MTNIYKQGLMQELRFLYRGLISIEQLWQLPVEDLDLVFQSLRSEQKQQTEESLLSVQTAENDTLSLKIAIVRDIVETKLQQQTERQNADAKNAQKRKLLEILARKQDGELEGKSIEELQQMIESL